MSNKPKYNWNEPSLFPDDDLHPASMEYRGIKTVMNKHGEQVNVAVITKTKDYFIEQARKIWGDAYDYSDSEYIHGKKPIVIYCPKHDYHFKVGMAQNHIMKERKGFKPTACPVCKYEQMYSVNYGNEWRTYLEPTPNQCRVRLKKEYQANKRKEKTPEQLAEIRARQEARANAVEARKRQREEEKARLKAEREATIKRKKEETRRRREAEKTARAKARAEAEQLRIAALQARFREEAPKKQGDGYIYQGIEQIKTTSDTVMVHCPNPDHEWHPMRVDLILQGCKCRECAGRHQPVEKRRDMFLAKFYKKHGHNHYQLTADDYVNNDTPIKVHCLVHHYDFETAPDNLLRGGGGCPYCTASEGEATILGWLDNHHINQVWHHQLPNDDRSLPLLYIEADFYLPDHRLIIEYHGEQHYKNIPHFYKGKRLRSFAVQRQRDQYLREYCERHGHRLLEIPYWDFQRIDEILTEELLNGNVNELTNHSANP